MNRRTFLRVAAYSVPVIGTCCGFAEAAALTVERVEVAVPNLPPAFGGLRVAFLTDIHHGPYIGLDFVARIVRTANALTPDLVIHGGDYSLRDAKFIRPCLDALAAIRAPLGSFGVLGNHDHWHGAEQTRAELRAAGISELTNSGFWLTRGAGRLRVCGVDDLWCGRVDVPAAVGDATLDDAVLLVSHNPDVAETLTDRRVGLVLSGHTHGGQVNVPGISNPFIPSRYGMKYARGLVEAHAAKVYISRGLGLTGLPVRLNCPPELTLLTLTATAK